MAGSADAGRKSGNRMLTVLSATALVATEALATAVAAAWALAGLTNLGTVGEYGLSLLFGAAALYATVAYFRKAYQVEVGSRN